MSVVDADRVAQTVKELIDMPDEEFRAEVDCDLRKEHRDPAGPERHQLRKAALRSPELVDRWFVLLSMMAKSVDGQLAAHQEDHEAEKADLRREIAEAEDAGDLHAVLALKSDWESAKAKYARTRAEKLRFKTGLDEWVIEARGRRDQLRASMYDSIVSDERNYYADRALRLRNAIAEHQASILSDDGIEPSAADEKLWKAL